MSPRRSNTVHVDERQRSDFAVGCFMCRTTRISDDIFYEQVVDEALLLGDYDEFLIVTFFLPFCILLDNDTNFQIR